MNNMPELTINCPDCEGKGRILLFSKKVPVLPCERCGETGQVPAIQDKWTERGAWFKALRIESRETLRDFANRIKADVMEASKAERGVIDPDEFFANYGIKIPTPRPNQRSGNR